MTPDDREDRAWSRRGVRHRGGPRPRPGDTCAPCAAPDHLDELVGNGLVTVEPVEVYRHTGGGDR